MGCKIATYMFTAELMLALMSPTTSARAVSPDVNCIFGAGAPPSAHFSPALLPNDDDERVRPRRSGAPSMGPPTVSRGPPASPPPTAYTGEAVASGAPAASSPIDP